MARIPYLDPERAPESVKRLLAPDRPQKIALLFGHAESNWPRLADLLLSILGEQRNSGGVIPILPGSGAGAGGVIQ